MRRARILLAVASAIAVFAAINLFLHANPPQTTPLMDNNPINSEFASQEGAAGIIRAPELLFVHTQTRPLFSSNRRKWVEAPLPAPEPLAMAAPVALAGDPVLAEEASFAGEPPNMTLIGVQKTPDGAQVLLLNVGTSQALWFKNGEKLEAWTVQMIEPGSVELALGERKIKLELYPSAPATGPNP